MLVVFLGLFFKFGAAVKADDIKDLAHAGQWGRRVGVGFLHVLHAVVDGLQMKEYQLHALYLTRDNPLNV